MFVWTFFYVIGISFKFTEKNYRTTLTIWFVTINNEYVLKYSMKVQGCNIQINLM